ncbi:alpha/beta family hydrolase [uncultured Paludibaculum sp.]|uniref:alpha/beta hydrolase n=1 Tax=uncultured Paludibaculum sp. TaxID=1765020 RepID=UPI002AABDB01|nr:alpha/beta family hydrolase [uncultured Paludibaculum sp.]
MRRIETLFIDGPVGRLEAMLEEPESGSPTEAALVCHPHPLGGGTMHNKVVHRLARGLRQVGAVTLRFNFRGVNLSEGTHDNGVGEVDDARAVLAVLRGRYPHLPLTVSGFSFGSRVAVQLYDGARRVILVGFPTVYRQFEILERCPIERNFIQSTNDEYGPRNELQPVYDRLWGPKSMHWVEAQDHFFAGALENFEKTVVEIGSLAI